MQSGDVHPEFNVQSHTSKLTSAVTQLSSYVHTLLLSQLTAFNEPIKCLVKPSVL